VSIVHDYRSDLRKAKDCPKQCFEAFFYTTKIKKTFLKVTLFSQDVI